MQRLGVKDTRRTLIGRRTRHFTLFPLVPLYLCVLDFCLVQAQLMEREIDPQSVDEEIGCGDEEIGCGDEEIGCGDEEIGCDDEETGCGDEVYIGVARCEV